MSESWLLVTLSWTATAFTLLLFVGQLPAFRQMWITKCVTLATCVTL